MIHGIDQVEGTSDAALGHSRRVLHVATHLKRISTSYGVRSTLQEYVGSEVQYGVQNMEEEDRWLPLSIGSRMERQQRTRRILPAGTFDQVLLRRSIPRLLKATKGYLTNAPKAPKAPKATKAIHPVPGRQPE